MTDLTSFKWATVTALSPLAIRLDGDSAALALIPDSLIDPAELIIGDRVRVELSNRKCVIHGANDGGAYVPPVIVDPLGIVRRTTTALSTGNSAYADMSANAAWGSAELLGGMTYSNGFVIPKAGVYRVEWSMLTVGATIGIMGIGVNAASMTGDKLHAAGTLQNGAAIFGNGSALVRLAAADKLTLWGYGNGAAVVTNAIAGQAPHWGAEWVRA